jgi:hypothetical protein
MVQVADGPQAGASGTSASNGIFEIQGTATGPATLRAVKTGFTPITKNAAWVPAIDQSLVSVLLDLVGPSLVVEPGNYTVTVTLDRATSADGAVPCSGYPDALLTRRYPATIASTQSSTFFLVNLNPPESVGFALGVAGSFLGFTIDAPEIWEILPNNTYLEIAGRAPTAEPATSTGSVITIPFSGSFEYCALTSPMGLYNNCFTTPRDERIVYAQCVSDHDSMVLTKR